MLDHAWTFVSDPANREVLGWIGGGIVAAGGAVWAVIKFFAKKRPNVTADRGSVAVGRDNINSTINIGTHGSERR